MNVLDALVGRLAVQQGLISEETLEQCLRAGGQGPLGRVLVQRGLLRGDVLASLTHSARRAEVLCAACGFNARPEALPPHAGLACPRCRGQLIVAPNEHDTRGDTKADDPQEDSHSGTARFAAPPGTGRFASIPGSSRFPAGAPGTGRFEATPATPGSGRFAATPGSGGFPAPPPQQQDPFALGGSARFPAGQGPGSGGFPSASGSARFNTDELAGLDAPSATVRLRRALSQRGGIVGDFEVLEELGRGGMGVVYKVRHLQRNEVLALKVLTAGALASKRQRTRFGREAEVMSRLRHPNIVQVCDHGSFGEALYMTMTLIEGKSLGELVRARRLSIRRAAEIARDVARGLQYAHEQGIVHRDVKPDNILIDRGGTPLITDFGLMRDLDDEGDRLTRSGAVVGTPYYMAPEQARGKRDQVGGRTDVYALGVVLYSMLTGDVPFKADTQIELLNRIVSATAVPPSKLNSEVNADLEAITLRCLAKAPDRRYQTAGDLGDDLDRYLRGEAATRAPREFPTAAVVAGACIVLLAVLTGAVLSNRAPTPDDGGTASGSDGTDAGDDGGTSTGDTSAVGGADADPERAETRARIVRLLEQADVETPGPPYRNALNDAAVALDGARVTWKDDAEFALWRARARQQLHQLSGALQDYGEAWSLSLPAPGPIGAEALSRSAWLQSRLGADREALAKRMGEAIDRFREDVGPWGDMARALRLYISAKSREDLEGSLERADDARRAEPRLAPAWALKGQLHSLLGATSEAISALDRALSLEPNNAQLFAGRGQLHAQASRLDRAAEDAERALRLDPQLNDGLKLRARLRALDRDLTGAISDLERAVEGAPKDVGAVLDLSRVYAMAERYEDASRVLTKAESLEPTLAAVYKTRARLELARLAIDAALESLGRGVDNVTNELDRQALHDRFIELAMGAKRHAVVRRYSEQRLAKDPKDRFGLCAKADHAAMNKDFARAAKIYEQCMDAHPKYSVARIQHFRLLFQMAEDRKKDPALLGRLQRFLDDNPEDPAVLCYAVHYYASVGRDPARASARARRATEVAPMLGEAWRTRTLAAAMQKRDREGLQFVERAILLDSDDYEAHRMKGNLLAQSNDMAGAVTAWLTSLSGNPFQDSVAENVMVALVQSNQYKQALQFAAQRAALTRITGQRPTVAIDIHRMNALVSLKRWGEAGAALDGIKQRQILDPTDSCHLAYGMAKMGRRKEAIALLQDVLAKHPDHPLAKRFLEQILNKR